MSAPHCFQERLPSFVALPVGQITPKQMLRLADLADNYGSGEVRLTVWQNLIIPNVPDSMVETLKKVLECSTAISNIGRRAKVSRRSQTGTSSARFRKFSATRRDPHHCGALPCASILA